MGRKTEGDERSRGQEAPMVITPRAVVDLARRIAAFVRGRRGGSGKPTSGT